VGRLVGQGQDQEPERSATCRLRLFGSLTVVDRDGHPVPIGTTKARVLLALLLLEPDRLWSVDALAEALWEGEPPPSARGTIHAHVSRLRQALRAAGVGELVCANACYRVEVDRSLVDVHRFMATVTAARAERSPAERLAGFVRATSLAGAPVVADLRTTGTLAEWVERWDEIVLAAREDELDAQLDAGHHAIAVAPLAALAAEHPYRERLHGQLMLALYRSGRQAEALRAYQHAHRVLGEEIGVVPVPALRRLE